MKIIEDTRQKTNQHDLKHSHFYEMGVHIIRCALPYGDYALAPKIAVDTKENMSEIASNLTNDHERFRNECEKARDAGCHLYILIETKWNIRNINEVHIWRNPRSPLSSKAVTGEKLEKIMKTMERRYNVRFLFCHPNESANFILKILKGEFENEEK